jgi:hypothetical protein
MMYPLALQPGIDLLLIHLIEIEECGSAAQPDDKTRDML